MTLLRNVPAIYIGTQPAAKAYLGATQIWPKGGSGIPMPVGDLPGWTQIFAEDFDTPAALGSIGTAYDWDVRGYDNLTDTSGNGTYTPDLVLSASNSCLDYYMHTEAGRPRVAAPVMMEYFGQTYGRYSVCFRSDHLPGYKMAFLLWPSSDDWNEGEIDWPEGELGEQMRPASAIKGSYNNGTMQFDPPTFTFSPTDTTDWHVATTEWEPGLIRWYWDGALLTQTTNPAGVPDTNFRWTLQAETSIGGPSPDPGVAGHLQVDWAVAYSYAGGSSVSVQKAAILIDSFATQDASLWLYSTGVTASGGTVSIPASSQYTELRSATLYDFTGSSVYAKVSMPSNPNSAVQAYMQVDISGGDGVMFLHENGHLTLREKVNGIDNDTYLDPYSPAQHSWLRLRESGGTVYWETSPDGSTWTVRRSKATTLDLSEVFVRFRAGNWNNVSNPGSFTIDSVNTLS